MLHDRFICTLRMPTYMAVGHKDGVRQVIQEEALMRFIEKKRPTLKGKPYNICF